MQANTFRKTKLVPEIKDVIFANVYECKVNRSICMQTQNYKYKARAYIICVADAYADPCNMSIATLNI